MTVYSRPKRTALDELKADLHRMDRLDRLHRYMGTLDVRGPLPTRLELRSELAEREGWTLEEVEAVLADAALLHAAVLEEEQRRMAASPFSVTGKRRYRRILSA